MTVIEASNIMYDWFTRHSVYSDGDFHLLPIDCDKNAFNNEKAAINCCLDQFQQAGLCSSTEVKGQKFWVLKQSLASIPQTVEICSPLASAISNTINSLITPTQTGQKVCEASKIVERDIVTLLQIIEALGENKRQEEESKKQDKLFMDPTFKKA